MSDLPNIRERIEDHAWIADVLADVLKYSRKNDLAEVVEVLDAPCQTISRLLATNDHFVCNPVSSLPPKREM